MDYQKAYKEALARAKEQLEGAKVFDYKEEQIAHDIRTTTYAIFPELAESEDELAWLKKYIEEEAYSLSMDIRDNEDRIKLKNLQRSLDWLEKQGEQKPADKVEPKFKVKYAGSEYNVFETKNIGGVTFYGIEDEPNHIDYVNAGNCEIISGYGIKESGLSVPTKPVMFSEQNSADFSDLKTWKYIVDAIWTEKEGIGQYLDSPFTEEVAKKLQKRFGNIEQKQKQYDIDVLEKHITKDSISELAHTVIVRNGWEIVDAKESQNHWSKEDEEHVNSLLKRLEGLCRKEFATTRFAINEDEDWLKSLKNRVLPKQELSEEDGRNLQGIIDEIEANKNNAPDYDIATYDRFLSWLQSLKQRCTWKPSDEQMKFLQKCIEAYNEVTFPTEVRVLSSLYNDLKKLKGE